MTPAANGSGLIIRAEGITKVFGGTVALQDVHFNVHRGTVNALMGENGAGKSTLMGILAGIHQPTAGRILLDGDEVTIGTPRDAGAVGIRLIHQELLLFPNLSVAENIFAGHELTSFTGLRLRAEEREAAALLKRLGQPLDPRALLGDLPVGQQQMVAISKALSQHVRVLIMDEPTSALSAREVESLFTVIRDLALNGVSVVYISHRIEEVTRIAHHITVLQDGRVAAEAAVSEIDADWIIEQMIGYDPGSLFVYEDRQAGEPLLEARGLSVAGAGSGTPVDDVTFEVAAGEIVGVYGLMGAGRTELLQCLIGEREHTAGEILVGGEPVDGPVHERIEHGLFLVPEDRQREGLVSALSVKANVSLASLDDVGSLGTISREREKKAVTSVTTDVGVKTANIDAPITSLSGGNQQKVVVAKALMTNPKVLLMDDPMRGIDVGAKAEVYRIMKRLAAEGIAIVFTSSDLVEVMGMSDRILVMAQGRITAVLPRAEATPGKIVGASTPQPQPQGAAR